MDSLVESNKLIRVADYVIDTVFQFGAEHIFMVTGRGALFLNDAVAAHKKIKGICTHHEQSAAYSAIAYAQYTGKLGACLVSTGCAGTNTITGVLNAWQDGIPCIFISGQNKLDETSHYTKKKIRTYGQQEADIIPIVKPITKYSTMITDPKKIGYELSKAIHFAKEGRYGPVWLDIPLDIQNMRIRKRDLEKYTIPQKSSPSPLQNDVKYLINSIKNAKRPTILIGSGVRAAGAVKDLENLIEKSSIPVTYSSSAPDIFGFDNSLSMGSVGIMGCTRSGNFTVQNSDLLLVLGCRLSSMTTGPDLCKFARKAKIVVVDIDNVEHSKNSDKIDRLIVSDVRDIIRSLLKENLKKTDKNWVEKCLHWKNIFPRNERKIRKSEKVDLYHLADSLSEVLPENSLFLSDSGMIELIFPSNLTFKKYQRCIHPASQGSMGFALPAMIGAYFASLQPVISVIGDGSIMMNLQELETIKYHEIPAKIFVVNNNAYAVIRKRQVQLFRSRTIGTDFSNGLSCPDFKSIANGFDIPYKKINNNLDLQKKIKAVIDKSGPVLCEVMGLEDQDYIRSSHARTENGRIVNRPLEDQAPYLNRDLFLSEMIIEPIDQ